VLVDCTVMEPSVERSVDSVNFSEFSSSDDVAVPAMDSEYHDERVFSKAKVGSVFFSAVVVVKTTESPSPPLPPSPPPPFPPIADMLRAAGDSDQSSCNATGESLRALASKGLVTDRAEIYIYDEANATPNLCGATPACSPQTSEGPRDVVFVVDASEAIGVELFYGKVLDLLNTLYCASHEGTQSQASIILYPAPAKAEVCGTYQVLAPLARYTTQEWFDKIEEIRADTSACCGNGMSATAPLAEALDGAGFELEDRGVHPADKRLVVVVSAGVPAPMLKEESCSELAPETFTSMTRNYPYSRAPSDKRSVTACSYAWRYTPAAAARLRSAGARVAAVNIAEGAGASVSPGAAAYYAGAPWPGACDADGYCTLAAQYGGELGRWVYATPAAALGSAADAASPTWASMTAAAVHAEGSLGFIREHDGDAYMSDLGAIQPSPPSPGLNTFHYDPGPRKTCEEIIPAGDRGQRQRSVISLPVSAHLVSLHGWQDDEVNAAVVPLMCQVSKPCALQEDDGAGPVVAQCHGHSDSGFNESAACLGGLVFAVCRHVDVLSAHHLASAANASSTSTDASVNDTSRLGLEGSNEDCFNDGGMMSTEVVGDNGGIIGVFECNRVCRQKPPPTMDSSVFRQQHSNDLPGRMLGRMEIEVKCGAGVDCVVSDMKWWAPGKEADDRRAETVHD
jgi:hypothetical protein